MANNQSYSKAAIFLHWFMALLIVIVVPLAWVMVDLEDSPQGPALFAWHKSIGFTIFLLAAIRLIWRLIAGVPAAPENTPVLANRVSGLIHFGMYVLLFAIPLSGWVMTSAAGHPLVYLELWQLPDLVAANDSLHETMEELHETLANILLGLIALHTAAALKHHFIQRDDVLARMLPFLRKR